MIPFEYRVLLFLVTKAFGRIDATELGDQTVVSAFFDAVGLLIYRLLSHAT